MKNLVKYKKDITIILDSSGSMNEIRTATIDGFNTFINEQKNTNEELCVSLIKFSDKWETIFDMENINEIGILDKEKYRPSGQTALFDTIGYTINSIGKRLSDTDLSLRPENVIVVVITDGEENSSLTYSLEQINSMIKHQTDVYKWSFVFIGSKQDAFKNGSQMGFEKGNILMASSSPEATCDVYRTMSVNLKSFSKEKSFFTENDQERQRGL